MEIFPIKDKEIFIKCLPWLRDIEFTDMTPLDCLARCLTGQYSGLLGIKEGKPVGILVYYIFDDTKMFVVGLWCKNGLKDFPESFFDYAQENNISLVRASSSRGSEAYERLTGMKKVFTVYERAL